MTTDHTDNAIKAFIKTHGIGVTGSIACGKSTVLSIIEDLGYTTFSADRMARELTSVGEEGWKALKRFVSDDFFLPDGELARSKMRAALAGCQQMKAQLEEALHPLIHQRFMHEVSFLVGQSICRQPFFYEAALIFEANSADSFRAVLVVYCDTKDQIQRLCHRDHLSQEAARKLVDSQFNQDQKRALGDYEISTSCDHHTLKSRVEEFLAKVS